MQSGLPAYFIGVFMKAIAEKLSEWLIPPPGEKIPVRERLLILWLLLLGLGLLLYLTGNWRISPGGLPLSGHGRLVFFCPACGGTRALNYLLQGQLYAAWRHNQLFVLALPLLFYGGLILLRSLVTGYSLTRLYISPVLLWLLLALIVLYTVLRNIPWPALDLLRPPV